MIAVATGSDAFLGATASALPRRLASAGSLWVLAVAVYGVGDLASTLVGLQLGATESNPIPAALIELSPGFLAVVVVLSLWKAATMAAFALVAWRLPSPYAAAVPAGLCLIGVTVVGWNASVILSVAS
ncbi:hypothetical protein SAMN06269185_0749 [Natronoarchaeum philippinense]|uniref:DUF5658 domain-containing protein n=1 Tax=Natronoarchaeum philippinense TaxID=558529 RepID=A0A285N6R6_NATPI|nr:hypothetical protein SAMN06269185_0749 [Natronoarchaeum philippinense]